MTTSFAHCQQVQASRFVKAFWQMVGKPTYQSETILPKGIVELIFSFSDPVPFRRNSQTIEASTPRCFVNGLSDMPIQLYAPQRQEFFGVELHPVAVKKLLKVPCGEFLNAITDLAAINKEFDSLWHQLAATDSLKERVQITQQWMVKKLSDVHQQEAAIAGFLSGSPEPIGVAALAAKFCYSPRQLHRKTQELFGMSTEALIRYKRYVHALQFIHHSNETLTRIGYHCHYYDQAHFIREFKEYTGLTPGEYRQQKSNLAGHLFQ